MSNENFEAIIDAILIATDRLPSPIKEKIKAELTSSLHQAKRRSLRNVSKAVVGDSRV
jgi:hypothetical protein